MTILLATHNPHKRDELRSILADSLPDLQLLTLDDISPSIGDIPETGTTLRENALIKARTVFSQTGMPTLSDDTGLEVDSLGGAPGVYSARYAGEQASYEDNIRKLLREMQGRPNRSAKFVTALAFIDIEGNEYHFMGEVEGVITQESKGNNGFGYDSVFAPIEDKVGRTFAEMSAEEKNAISHRGRGLRSFSYWLSDRE